MNKDPLIFLKHILESIERIERFSQGVTKQNFIKNDLVHSAIIRQLEIIGEAVKNIPKKFRNDNPEVPWNEITGTRDKLIHHYFGVDYNLAYDIVKKEIPKLKNQILKMLNR